MILAGDIGGTKTILALFSLGAGAHTPLAEATFPSADYGSLELIIQEFMAANPAAVEVACFGVAGPVVAGRASVTNLPWMIDAAAIRERLGFGAVHLLNDLESIGHAVRILEPTDIATLNEGTAEAGGAIGVIAPGTGLGEAFLTWDGSRYKAHPSEGGHASFGPNTTDELELLRYLQAKLGHVSYERVCSGLGIPNIYGYFRDRVFERETPEVAAALADDADPTPVIVRFALDPSAPCPACVATIETFVNILGSEAGNLALKVLATGGIYIGGGIPPRILEQLRHPRFLAAFREKGRFRDLLDSIPIHVILNSKAALLGAASFALT
ncbi:glucokinase [Chloroflexales bacterium ZM16-3]|nr:glucokinase [Chloroflexales bacterium ZM16-3]